jgi:DNA sulfur modification protein DndC
MTEDIIDSAVAPGEFGLKSTIRDLVGEIKDLYLSDEIPWVIGYSGGKDSTAVTQLIWTALSELAPEDRKKSVHIISTDTLVENPVVSTWVRNSMQLMGETAAQNNLPIYDHILTPEIKDTFWVNLIGRGYPAPRQGLRWCTDRLKIRPADAFIKNVLKKNGEAIIVLGTRKAESAARAARIKKWSNNRRRELLSSSTTSPNAYVYAPIEDWSNDDVWIYLMQYPNPWGNDNHYLQTMYQGASADGECPLVVDTTTPSCGNSRFGCWVCTLVSQDKSMSAMIQNDKDKEWMTPLLMLRNELDPNSNDNKDYDKRDFRRLSGRVQLRNKKKDDDDGVDRSIPGPYTQNVREEWLRKLLRIQKTVHDNPLAPPEFRDLELVTQPELDEIRRIWVTDKHEIEDRLPIVYQEIFGKPFAKKRLDDRQPFGGADMAILREICGDDDLHFELVRELLDVERSFRTMSRRSKLFDRIENAFKKNFYENAEDAVGRAVRIRDMEQTLKDIDQPRGDLSPLTGETESVVSHSEI